LKDDEKKLFCVKNCLLAFAISAVRVKSGGLGQITAIVRRYNHLRLQRT